VWFTLPFFEKSACWDRWHGRLARDHVYGCAYYGTSNQQKLIDERTAVVYSPASLIHREQAHFPKLWLAYYSTRNFALSVSSAEPANTLHLHTSQLVL
jgi:hypothetical protein